MLSGDTSILLLVAALFLVASPIKSRANPDDLHSSELREKPLFWLGDAHDSLCSDVMCIECYVEGVTARYTLRSTGVQKLGWMAIGFGHNMGDSPMVIVWPTRDEDGYFDEVILSQRKAPYQTMPTPDKNPPLTAELLLSNMSFYKEESQIVFTRHAPQDGMQDIIWAFSRTPPRSADPDTPISIHHKIGRGKLNLTRTARPLPEPVPQPTSDFKDEVVESSVPNSTTGHEEVYAKAQVVRRRRGERAFASLMHGALCMTGFLLVIPFGVFVVRYAKLTGRPEAFQLHRLLQFGVAGGFIGGGTLAYIFMDNDEAGVAEAHKVGSAGLLLLYVVQCMFGSWVSRIPVGKRTRVHVMLLTGLGTTIILLALYQTWLGLVTAGRDVLVSFALLIFIVSLYIFGAVTAKRKFGSM